MISNTTPVAVQSANAMTEDSSPKLQPVSSTGAKGISVADATGCNLRSFHHV